MNAHEDVVGNPSRRFRRTAPDGSVVHYVYHNDNLLLELDGAGNRIREYSYLPGIDRPHSMRQWANGEGGKMYYYQLQAPGHVNGLVDVDRNLVNHYRYTPFGTPANGFPVEGTQNPLQYMARELDATTGLYYVRNRWYDPQIGRFVSEDPIGLAGGINNYEYVRGNPISFRDPMGLCHDGGYLRTSGFAGDVMDPIAHHTGMWSFAHNGQQYHGHIGGGSFWNCDPPSQPSGPSERGVDGLAQGGGVLPGGSGRPGGPPGAVPLENDREALQACYDSNNFSSLFGDGRAADIVHFVEIGSGVSLGLDVIAIVRKGGGLLGTNNTYASGFNMIGKDIVRSLNRADLVGTVVKWGDRITPPLALFGAFTLAYNSTIDVQCRLGFLE